MAQLDGGVKEVVEIRDDVREPGMFHVIFLNDNYTPMDFVVKVLTQIFNKSENDAYKIMMKIHNDGRAIVGTYVEDVAITKSETVKNVAKNNKFPLNTKVQPA